jgi:hypothetical protein
MGYYIHRDGQSVGVTVDQLREQARAGQLKREDYVYQDETAQWTSAGTMAELAQDWPGATPPPPPPPPAYQPPPAQPQPPAYQAPPTYAQAPQQAYQQQSSQQRPSTSGGVSVDGIDVIFKRSFDMYLQHWQALLWTAGMVLMPLSLAAAVLTWVAAVAARSLSGGFGVFAAILGILGTALVGLVYAVASPLVMCALTSSVIRMVAGGQSDWRWSWRVVFQRIGPLAITLLLGGLAVTVGAILVCLPGIAAAVLLSFAVPVVFIEGTSGVDGLKRSSQLVLTDWLRVLILFLATMACGALCYIPVALLIWLLGNGFIVTIVRDLLMLVVLPLPTIALVLLYFDIRRKHEGLDEASLARKLV